jgi:hypothetical protein
MLIIDEKVRSLCSQQTHSKSNNVGTGHLFCLSGNTVLRYLLWDPSVQKHLL